MGKIGAIVGSQVTTQFCFDTSGSDEVEWPRECGPDGFYVPQLGSSRRIYLSITWHTIPVNVCFQKGRVVDVFT